MAAGLLVTTLVTALLLGGVVGVGPWDGVFLFRDFVTVPDPVLGANTLGGDGAPRAVPLDAVVAALSALLPPGLVARLLLVAPLLLVGSGLTMLLRRHGPVATTVGAGLAISNPYVAERLLLGQAPTLLGYAMIPWLVLAVRADTSWWRRCLLVLVAAAPAAITPAGAVMAGVTVLVAALALPVDRPRPGPALALLVPVGVLSLPWLVTALGDPAAGAVSTGADAFAVRADGPLGTVGSVLTLGGVWAPGAWPDSREHLAVVAAQLLLVIGAAVAWWLLRRSADPTTRRALDVAAAAYAGVVGAVLLLAGPLLPVWRELQQVPGIALARDTHRWLGWSALAVCVLVGLGVARLVDRAPLAAAGASLAVLALGILTVPDVPGRLAHDLHPVTVPAEWDSVVEILDDGPDGRVLVLPWQPFRQVDWVGEVQFLDPFPRALESEVVHARDLTVRRDGAQLRVGGEDPAFAADLTSGVLDPALLREQGISRVVIWLGSPGAVPAIGDGFRVVHDGAKWQVLQVEPGGAQSP